MNAIIFIVLPMIGACIIAFFLGASWQALRDERERDREDHERIEADRVLKYGDQHPWELS